MLIIESKVPSEPYGSYGGDRCFPSPQPDPSLHCRTTNMGLVHHTCLCPAFAGTHCAYSQRDGQAELTWVAAELVTY